MSSLHLVAGLLLCNAALAQGTLAQMGAGGSTQPITATAVQDSSAATPLSLMEAMRQSLQRHPNVQTRRAAIAAAISDLEGAQWRRFPTAGVTGGQGLSGNDPGFTVFVTQPLWTAGRITSEIEGRQAQVEASGLSLQETEQELLQRVAQAYSEVLRLSERVQVAEDNVQEHERLRGIIQRRVERDVGAAIDLSLADARLQQATLERLQARSQRATTLAALGQLIGGPVGPLTPPETGPLRWTDPQALAQAVLDHSPTLKRLQADAVYAQTQVRTAQSVLWPQVSLRVQRASQGGGSLSGADTRAYVLMEYQPGAGLSAASSRDAAAHRLRAAQTAIESATLELRDLSTTRFHEAQVALNALAPTSTYAEANADVVTSYLRQFAAGRKSWQEVMNAQRELAQARQAVADAQAGVRLGVLRIQILTGELTQGVLETGR